MSNPEVDCLGNKYWYNEKRIFHRIDGPAVEYKHGTKEWFFNGKRHRIDGPAIEYYDGDKCWWIAGKFIYRLYKTGTTDKGDMSNLSKVMKQSIIDEVLKIE